MIAALTISILAWTVAALPKDEPNAAHLRSRRVLEVPESKHFFSLIDARTTTQKNEQPSFNILSFGTSQTFGHGLEHRDESYPYVIADALGAQVDNLALPSTAADHPSLCLQSMIPDAETKNYDLITIEYPSNQSDGVTLLLRRLRERYPQAVIIYINIWSMISRATFEDKQPGMDPNPKLQWSWNKKDPFSASPDRNRDCSREICHRHEIDELLADVKGLYYTMDTTISTAQVLDEHWFGEDWHHLSKQGHGIVAQGVLETLHERAWDQFLRKDKPLGSWAEGDRCFNWYYSGQTNGIQYDENDAKLICVNDTWCSLNILNKAGATITFTSDYKYAVPVALGYLTKGTPRNHFPNVQVRLNDAATVGTIRGHVDRTTRTNPGSGATVTSYYMLGAARPGRNTVFIQPDPTVNGADPEAPFGVVGIYMCGASVHYHFPHMGLGALNFDNQSDAVPQPFDKALIMTQTKGGN